jgi:outer membrane receptor protein involved in Fe transport
MASWFVLIALSPVLRAQTTPQQPASAPAAPEVPPVHTSITVTEQIVTEAPANITDVNAGELRETPGVNLDDRLRQVPGFSLFRRTSSLVAHPTTQGVSLRGLGSTGASRTLVLWDGVPMNDPFGGWVYWTRISPEQIERAEVSRGASTSVFGDRAMAGAISILSHDPDKHLVTASYEGGNLNTHELTFGASDVWRHVAASAFVRAFSTDGYFIVPRELRGAVDTPAGVDFVAGNARFDLFGGANRFFAKLDILAEDRANGTVLQHNSTSLGTLSGNYSWQGTRDGISVIGFHTREEFHSAFSSISADRNSERLTYRQTVPSQATGASAFWTHSGTTLNTLFGADIERDQGTSIDSLVPTGVRIGGGNRLEHGIFGQANFGTQSARLFIGARHTFIGDDTFFGPSGGFVLGRGRLRARGSVYRSFRAPTLNELYREFRVGNTVTLANSALRPETLFGAEAGFDYTGEGMRLSVTAFRNSMDRLITNVTLQTGATITRQRQNAAAALARGFEAEFRKSWRYLSAEFAYMFVDSRYVTGLRIPEVPKNQGSAQLSYARNGTLLSAALRSYSSQFDDDLNQFLLAGFTTVQFAARQRLGRGVSAMLAIENLLDRTYYVAFTPTPSIGAPRLWRAGLRWEGRLW